MFVHFRGNSNPKNASVACIATFGTASLWASPTLCSPKLRNITFCLHTSLIKPLTPLCSKYEELQGVLRAVHRLGLSLAPDREHTFPRRLHLRNAPQRIMIYGFQSLTLTYQHKFGNYQSHLCHKGTGWHSYVAGYTRRNNGVNVPTSANLKPFL